MIEDSTEEFLTALSGEHHLPSPKRRDMGALSALIATTPWLNDIPDIATAQ
jgi:hypothetical protein